jgi:hypothetical protein
MDFREDYNSIQKKIQKFADTLHAFIHPSSSWVEGVDDQAEPAKKRSEEEYGWEVIRRQEAVVSDGLKRVKSAAAHDKTMQQIFNSKEDPSLRESALAAMMGINHGSEKTDSAPVDLTAVRARRSLDKVEAMRGCATLECLRVAHQRPAARSKFNFPHFFIAGWQKSATTSLFSHLSRHPEVNRPWLKEPEFFSDICEYNAPEGCPPEEMEAYIQRTLRVNRYAAYNGRLATYEASTHYSRFGQLIAPTLFREMPWIKVIFILRDPISRAASMLIHLVDKSVPLRSAVGGCLTYKDMDLGYCLLNDSQISGQRGPMNYSLPLESWLSIFPTDQIHIAQYESLIDESTQKKELERIKNFIGIDPNLPEGEYSTLSLRNSRKGSINPDGWPMKRDVYQHAIDTVLADCEKVANLIEKFGYGSKKEWMARWEKVWDDNMKTCDAHGNCMIQLS